MNATMESFFGPASEKVDVSAFVESAKILYQDTLSNQSSSSSSTVVEECRFCLQTLHTSFQSLINFNSVSDIHDSLYNLWNNPTLSATLIKDHDHTVAALHASVNPKKSRKTYTTTDSRIPEVSNLQKSIESVSLTAWR